MNYTDADNLAPIYETVNYKMSDAIAIHCEGCRNIAWPPNAGSYPSSLSHYESILGRFPQARTKARILFVLEAPRSGEDNFKIANPRKDVSTLAPNEHRYFCLTQLAWENLKLDRTVSAKPCWPTHETASYFLRRYLYNAGWSYDGIFAYFLYLFRPETAVITNLAKCHFGDNQREHENLIYDTCARLHLQNEGLLIQPNLLVSLSKKFDQSIINKYVPSLRSVPLLNLFHPAARGRIQPHHKRQRFLDQVELNEKALQQLGYDVPALQAQWEHDMDLARNP